MHGNRHNYKPASKVYNAIRSALKMHGTGRPFGAKGNRCEWKLDNDGFYQTSCNGAFTLDSGTPSENKMVFCPFCGNEIQENTACTLSQSALYCLQVKAEGR
jgi:hypothetical protein